MSIPLKIWSYKTKLRDMLNLIMTCPHVSSMILFVIFAISGIYLIVKARKSIDLPLNWTIHRIIGWHVFAFAILNVVLISFGKLGNKEASATKAFVIYHRCLGWLITIFVGVLIVTGHNNASTAALYKELTLTQPSIRTTLLCFLGFFLIGRLCLVLLVLLAKYYANKGTAYKKVLPSLQNSVERKSPTVGWEV